MGWHAPKMDGNAVRQHMDAQSREPFIDMLALLLAIAPDRMTWQIMARKRPDKWAESLVVLAELAGLTDAPDQSRRYLTLP
jgi:hypothetical protein